jgi:hypothetical protein
MPPALQRRTFCCAHDELAAMLHFPRRLEPKRLALALKKVKTVFPPYRLFEKGPYLLVAN